jgi:hypothetical protein
LVKSTIILFHRDEFGAEEDFLKLFFLELAFRLIDEGSEDGVMVVLLLIHFLGDIYSYRLSFCEVDRVDGAERTPIIHCIHVNSNIPQLKILNERTLYRMIPYLSIARCLFISREE